MRSLATVVHGLEDFVEPRLLVERQVLLDSDAVRNLIAVDLPWCVLRTRQFEDQLDLLLDLDLAIPLILMLTALDVPNAAQTSKTLCRRLASLSAVAALV